MLGTLFADPMRVPYWFTDDDHQMAAMAVEWLKAGELKVGDDGRRYSDGLFAADTETDYDPTLNLNIEVAKERVISAFCAFRDVEGVSPEALITGDDVPDLLREQGYVACKAYVVDVGYVSAEACQVLGELLVHVWNLRFERKVFARMGLEAGFLRDLMLYQAVLDQGATGAGKFYTGLAKAAESYLGWNLEGKGGIQLSYRPIDVLPELSDEQKAYAAQDAVATALLAPVIIGACAAVTVDFGDGEVSLADVGDLESGASSFLDKMQVTGVPLVVEGGSVTVDGVTVDGWKEYCRLREVKRDEAKGKIADIEHELAGGSGHAPAAQGLLPLGDVTEARFEPSFEPGSHKQLIAALNRLVPEQVKAYTVRHLGAKKPRLFVESDSVDKDALKLMGGDLAKAINEWSSHNKLTSDSGIAFVDKWINPRTGSLHPEIKQALVNTGRLSMANPPMQNRPPSLKAFHRPGEGRCVLYADLSQAELRTLAHMSQDERMLGAFRSGQDLHTLTATEMFELDIVGMMAAPNLSDEDLVQCAIDNRVEIAWEHTNLNGNLGTERYISRDGTGGATQFIARSKLEEQVVKAAALGRGKAKVPNFGVAYGMAGPTLARTLCLQGVDTTADEGKDILNRWMDTYPGVKQWLLDRDAYIDGLAANPPECDFSSTWKLIRWFKPVTNAKFALKKRLDRFPTPAEIASHLHPKDAVAKQLREQLGRDASDEELAAELDARADFVRWVLSFSTPVVVAADGTPFAFASRTLGGRRRLFQVSAAGWLDSQVQVILTSHQKRVAGLRDEFGRRHRLTLSGDGGKALGFMQARKRVPKNLHEALVTHVLSQMPAQAVNVLGKQALSDQIRSMKQQFRNAPIQGTVGDVALYAYALLDERLKRFNGRIVPSLTVHDSIMLISDLAVAREGAKVLQETMEEALEHFCPSVPAKADAAILHSFKEDDVVDPALLDAAEAAEAAQAA